MSTAKSSPSSKPRTSASAAKTARPNSKKTPPNSKTKSSPTPNPPNNPCLFLLVPSPPYPGERVRVRGLLRHSSFDILSSLVIRRSASSRPHPTQPAPKPIPRHLRHHLQRPFLLKQMTRPRHNLQPHLTLHLRHRLPI